MILKNSLRKVNQDTTPIGKHLFGALGVTGIANDPATTIGSAAVLVGRLARMYESRAVRNVLIRLGSVPRGSSKFEKALLDLDSAFVTAAQTEQNSHLGKTLSNSIKQKMSQRMKGNKYIQEMVPKNATKLIDSSGGTIYCSVREAAGMKQTTLQAMLSGVNRNKTLLEYL